MGAASIGSWSRGPLGMFELLQRLRKRAPLGSTGWPPTRPLVATDLSSTAWKSARLERYLFECPPGPRVDRGPGEGSASRAGVGRQPTRPRCGALRKPCTSRAHVIGQPYQCSCRDRKGPFPFLSPIFPFLLREAADILFLQLCFDRLDHLRGLRLDGGLERRRPYLLRLMRNLVKFP